MIYDAIQFKLINYLSNTVEIINRYEISTVFKLFALQICLSSKLTSVKNFALGRSPFQVYLSHMNHNVYLSIRCE